MVDLSSYGPALQATNPMEQTNNFLETAGKAATVQHQNIENRSASTDLAYKQLGIARGLIAGILNDPDLGKVDKTKLITDHVVQGTRVGLYSPAIATEALMGLPADAPGQRKWAEGHLNSILSAQQILEQTQGQPQTTNDNAYQHINNVPRNPAFPPQPRTSFPTQYGPGQEYQDENGQKNTLGPAGPAGQQPPPNKLGVAPPKAVNPPVINNPASQATGWKAEPQAGLQAAPTFNDRFNAARRSGSLPTALAPGALAAEEASRKAYASDLVDSGSYLERSNPLRMAIPLLEKLGTTGSGPGKDIVNHVKAFAQSAGLPIPNADDVTSFAKAKKYLSQNAGAIAPPGTNIPSVMNAFESNPNMAQPNEAATDLSKTMLGLLRMKRASLLAFKETGKPSNEYSDWASNTWSRTQDPRAYTADLMSPEQRDKLRKSIKPGSAQAEKFRISVETAKRLGLYGDVEGHELP